jgi:uncharacterized damage-inducible protein DinB
MSDAMAVTLEACRTRIVRVFPAQIRAAVADLSEDQVWWRPNESSNSIANILLHLTGSLRHYLVRNLGGHEFVRDRDAEFADRSRVSRDELLARFDSMIADADETLRGMRPERLADPSPEPSMHRLVIEDLLNVTAHLANHTGQIVWIAKMLSEGTIDELWIRAHRSHGAWRGE